MRTSALRFARGTATPYIYDPEYAFLVSIRYRGTTGIWRHDHMLQGFGGRRSAV